MTTAIEYALMSGASYISNRPDVNKFPTPSGWSTTRYDVKDSGFEAISFIRSGTTLATSTEIVISYAGTDFSAPGTDFTQANIPLASGYSSAQLEQAADYYLQIKALNPGATITFTGHSLGGGLAALMAVFFDETAVTFDQAPFSASATEHLDTDADGNPITRSAAEALRAYLSDHVPVGDLVKLDAYIAANHIFDPSGIAADTLAGRETKVTNTNVLGEVLSLAPVSAFDRIGINADTNSLAQQNNMLVARLDMHSQALLTAMLQSGDTPTSTSSDHTLGQVSFKLPDLLKMIFDKNLFASDPLNKDAPVENFLERLVKHEAGSGTALPADAMVTRFTADLWKLAQDGGLTLTDQNTGNPDLNEVSKTLIAFAMQFYYQDTANALDPEMELFSTDDLTGGIRFDIEDVAGSLAEAKGYDQYFKGYLGSIYNFSAEEEALIKQLLPQLRDWYVQAGAGSMSATDALNRGAFMLGGASGDTLTGGSKADLLVGNAGGDTLKGGKGNDTLIGGAGFDTYVVNAGDGFDTFLDSDGSGVVRVGGIEAKGSAGLADSTKWMQLGTDTWVDSQNGVVYSKSIVDGETQLLIHQGNSNILVKGWNEGELGIELDAGTQPAAAALPATGLNLQGDLKPLDTDTGTDGIQPDHDDLDNIVVTAEAEPDRQDTLYDSPDNDRLQGQGGNDTLFASRGGDDLLEGGAGQDWLSGGAGKDTLAGGADSDVLLGGADNDQLFSNDWSADLAAVILASETQPGTGGRGDWLSADTGADTLVGNAGNDVLLGGENEDLLIGGGGNDNIYGDQSGDAGIDWTLTRSELVSGAITTYTTNIQNGDRVDAAIGAADVIYGGAGDDWIVGDQGNDIIDAGADNDVVFGGQGADVILGQGGNDVLIGNAGVQNPQGDSADYIDGGDGDDELWGAGGNDHLLGGVGKDILIGDKSGTLPADEGEDVLDGGDGDDILWGGGKVDTLLGGGDNDYLFGEAGNDTLDGGSGIDHLAGGADDDTYLNVSDNDTIFDIEGHNTIVLANATGLGEGGLSASVQTGDDGSQYMQLAVALDDGSVFKLDSPFFANGTTMLQFAGGDGLDLETLVGNTLATPLNLLNGDEGGRVYGGAGNDLLTGAVGGDTLLGYAGNDTLHGGGGVDVLIGGAENDTLLGESGNDTLNGEEGDDTLEGGDGDDRLVGGDGNDALDGGLGNDTLLGGAGDDVLRAGQDGPEGGFVKNLTGGEGSDTLIGLSWGSVDTASYANDPGAVVVDLGRGYANDGWGRTDNLVDIDAATGSAFDDVLIGNSDANVLSGGEGNDVLDGVEGDDTLVGGGGADSYLMRRGSGSDTIIEQSGEASVLVLEGLALEDLRGEVQGNDLLLKSSKALDSVLIKDYATDSVGWRVQLAGAVGDQALSEVLSANEAALNALGLMARLKQDFQDAWYVQETGTLQEWGWKDMGDGVLQSPVGFSVMYSESLNRGIVDLYSTATYVPGLNQIVHSSPTGATGATIPPLPPGFNGSATVYRGSGFTAAQFGTVVINSDDEVIESVWDGRVEIGQTTGNWDVTVDWYSQWAKQQQFTTPTIGWIQTGQMSYVQGVVEYSLRDTTSISFNGRAFPLVLTAESATEIPGISLAQQVWNHQNPDNQFTLTLTKYEEMISNTEIHAGAGNNTIFAGGGDVVNAGAGNDYISFYYDYPYGYGNRKVGFFVDAGTGDDEISGGAYDDVLVGGEGDDNLNGGSAGSDTYGLSAFDNGKDVIIDDGVRQLINEGSAWSNLSNDVIVFSEGVLLGDLSFGLGTLVDSDVLATLDITWGEGNQVRVALDPGGLSPVERHMQWAGTRSPEWVTLDEMADVSGFGVEQLIFADGTVASINDLLLQVGPIVTQGDFYAYPDGVVVYAQTLNTHQGVLDASGQDGLVILRGSSGQFHGENPRDEIRTGAGDTFALIRNLNGTDLVLQNEGRVNVMSAHLQRISAEADYSQQLEVARIGNDLQFSAVNLELGWDAATSSEYEIGVLETFEVFAIKDWFAMTVTPEVYLNGRYALGDLLTQFSDLEGGAIAVGSSVRFTELDVTQAEIDWWEIGFLPEMTVGEYQDFNSLRGLSGPLENVFVFEPGMGVANTLATSDLDLLQFGDSFDPRILAYSRSGDDLVISLGPDSLRLAGAYLDDAPLPSVSMPGWKRATFDGLRELGVALAGAEANRILHDFSGNEVLWGDAGSDYLWGSDTNVLLVGGSGVDEMAGGLGDDAYVVSDPTDMVYEFDNEGTDTVYSSVIYALPEHVENLTLTGTVKIDGTGNELANVLRGNSAINTLGGLDGNDTIYAGDSDTAHGGNGNDTLISENTGTWSYLWGEAGDDVLVGGSFSGMFAGGLGSDTIIGGAGINFIWGDDQELGAGSGGNDTITGGNGYDYVVAGAGDDLVYGNDGGDNLSGNAGNDALSGGAGNDTLNGGAGADAMWGGQGNDIYRVDNVDDSVTELAGEGWDQVTASGLADYTLPDHVEGLTLSGTVASVGSGNALDNLVYGDVQKNTLYGNGGNDYLSSADGDDTLNGGDGNDVLQGGAGADFMLDLSGASLMQGGDGNDMLYAWNGNAMLIGGKGNDNITALGGNRVMAFNRGDGNDTLWDYSGAQATVSLGKGIAYADMSLSRTGNDLVLGAGAGESISFKDWYTATGPHTAVNLQAITESMAAYAPGGTNALLDNKIETFDFLGVVAAFDAARVANPALTAWSLTSALAGFHLSGSDAEALGGDLAYQYGKTGNLSNVGLMAVHSLMSESAFGTGAQALRPLASLQEGATRLM